MLNLKQKVEKKRGIVENEEICKEIKRIRHSYRVSRLNTSAVWKRGYIRMHSKCPHVHITRLVYNPLAKEYRQHHVLYKAMALHLDWRECWTVSDVRRVQPSSKLRNERKIVICIIRMKISRAFSYFMRDSFGCLVNDENPRIFFGGVVTRFQLARIKSRRSVIG